MLSNGRCLWKLSTPFNSPFSDLMFSPIFSAISFTFGSSAVLIASARVSAFSRLGGTGAGPAPARWIESPQNLVGQLHPCTQIKRLLLISEEWNDDRR
jgi:hypothetical protein